MIKDYNNMTEDQVVKYIKSELKKGRSYKDIEEKDFGVSERVIRKRLARKGIKIDLSEYDSSKKLIRQEQTKEVKPVEVVKCDDNMNIVIPLEYENKLIGLAKNYDKIMAILTEYEGKYEGRYDDIIIELPIETKKDYRATARINNVIWEQFGEFCNQNPLYTKRDLLSMALKEYMEKYKKITNKKVQ